MNRIGAVLALRVVGLVVAFAPACGGHGGAVVPSDGGTDGGGGDFPAPPTLQIAITGCASFDPVAARCAGTPPLTVAFAPVGSPELTRFEWTFGDGSPLTRERAPRHTYTLPGEYLVRVVGGGSIGGVEGGRQVTVVGCSTRWRRARRAT